MLIDLGYSKPLFILPFDHRESFVSKLLGGNGDGLRVKELKQIIYDGFSRAVEKKMIPHSNAAILVDEEFGDAILRQAKKNGHLICLSTEKSGQTEFSFEYGDEFAQHIKKYDPDFVKALVRYNPAGDHELNIRQQARLKILSEWCHRSGYKFLLEVLISATAEEVDEGMDVKIFDEDTRPKLALQMVRELHDSGVDPDVWKVEGFVSQNSYKELVNRIQSEGRENVGLIILGRGGNGVDVERWLRSGHGVQGVIGFAVGRTIFWQALKDYLSAKINRDQAVEVICKNYTHFYKVFTNNL